jgi:RNA:NAD 2'-phosphotransferase (TPT1/KptA family)
LASVSKGIPRRVARKVSIQVVAKTKKKRYKMAKSAIRNSASVS